MRMLRLTVGMLGAAMLLASGAAQAQLAPTPQKSPRTPVSKELLSGRTSAAPPPRIVTGTATIVDSERLRINDIEMRLFGVVPPQLGASFGPQARAVVDALAKGDVTCQIKDRTREGYYLALCHNEANADFGIELLRRGLAVAARGSLRTSEYGTPYLAAEQAAQNQRLGLWSTALPAAASENSIREAALKTEAARVEAEQAKIELAKAEALKAEALKAAEAAKMEAELAVAAAPATALKINATEAAGHTPLPHVKPDAAKEKEIAASPTATDVQAVLASQQSLDMPKIVDERSFFEKFQILLSGLLLFFTTVIILVGSVFYKGLQRKEELRSIAAALRGELMAARSVCQARLSKIAHDRTDSDTSWPRIRTIVFQAYVGKLGCLGAEISRQIASIYGMASDYASYYNTTDARAESTSKRQALEALVQYIEEISPKLMQIETSGELPKAPRPVSFRSALPSPAQTLSLASSPASPTSPNDGPKRPIPTAEKEPETRAPSSFSVKMSEAKSEILSELKPQNHAPSINESEKEMELRAARAKMAQTRQQHSMAAKPSKPAEAVTPQAKAKPVEAKTATPKKPAEGVIATTATKSTAAKVAAKTESAAQSALKAVSQINFKAPIMESLSKIKDFASSQFDSDQTIPQSLDEFTIPDYANLTEEELEALLYAEEELILASPVGKSHRA